MNRISMISGMIWAGLACGMAAGGDSLSIDGYEFALIGDPGNRDTNEFEVPFFPDERIGGVDSEYQMATTEVSVGQYFEFVEAYYPFYVKNTGSDIGFTWFTGLGIRAAFGQVHILDGISPHRVADMSWEYAARYLNWLHHGKVVEEWAFETGVYNTSTFAQDSDGVWQHQTARSPGARFFFPTWDEWIKAGYWDPYKDNGTGGYWRFQNGSDVEPQAGLPEEGGERNAGDDFDLFPLNVLSYPDVPSPWGMFDMAGGYPEFTETISGTNRSRRLAGGSGHWEDRYGDIFSNDIIGYGRSLNACCSNYALRIATTPQLPVDLDQNGTVNYFDVARFLRWFIDQDHRADLRLDGVFNLDDVRVFLGLYAMSVGYDLNS